MKATTQTNAAACDGCGRIFPISQLDAKPGPGHFTTEDLASAADAGVDFNHLECGDCYGPNYASGA